VVGCVRSRRAYRMNRSCQVPPARIFLPASISLTLCCLMLVWALAPAFGATTARDGLASEPVSGIELPAAVSSLEGSRPSLLLGQDVVDAVVAEAPRSTVRPSPAAIGSLAHPPQEAAVSPADTSAKAPAAAPADPPSSGSAGAQDAAAAGAGMSLPQKKARPVEVAAARQSSRPVVLAHWARWGEDPRPWQSATANIDAIDVIAPYWYTLQADGSLLSREADHGRLQRLVAWNHRQLIVLVNKSPWANAILTSSAVRRTAVNSLYNLCRRHGFTGVEIDFENLGKGLRWNLTAFMRELSAKFRPAGLKVFIAVGPKVADWNPRNDWSDVYDYRALAPLVDGMVIMAYDLHGTWSGPGPVVSLPWIDDVLRYACGVMPREKVLLGIAGYGYDWSSAGVTGVPSWRAPQVAARYGAPIRWDDASQEAHFTYWSGGRRHDVWYENSYSIAGKLNLARRYNIGGVALWSLGQEDSRTWQVIRSRYR